ncbi:Group II intron-encoded protein LtrA [Piscirickettsia salmonis]|uniref:Group II intron-encoded protein LtrA n=1 Tax=Piscirickettsia salmonis TaxID=1238 RepID=A0A9Q6LK58_PISSA|nr:reverse transcriptase domain-containing protein [Piscirickettsia salmonis]QGN94727.1 Group II intron-encoded protein LtrA [Piscirickettsia salmonis]QGO06322.1 Group II intron-encoded protein LtrA [Piscirickettsia salmonis]QGO34648.1 Group II intron-encoded protein LtrA [Piscirickettsia salmonis]QGO38264.1 Group II intron-encoded protein LtrA [Piscirickettsia salmonis]QGO41881.1 Group II intron-encoded protein LtrA [Piscirickettsia salmonis]
MEPTETSSSTETKLERIAWLSAVDPGKVFNQVMHHFNLDSLLQCFHELNGKKALGVDGVTKEQYEENLIPNLLDLLDRMKRMAYIPGAVRLVLIPKEGRPGAMRPLGISNFEDKIIQKITQKVLESIYDPIFLGNSYGFRPGKSCHNAIRALDYYLFSNRIESIIDVDLENYFGTIDHNLLIDMLETKIKDQRFIRYIIRMFKAGVLSKGELTMSDEGVPQGSVCSPIISNIFAHYVIDDWFEKVVKKHCQGKVEMFRYADDMVICCQFRNDAGRIKKALAKRLSKFRLKMNEDKTREIAFSKQDAARGIRQGAFDFLGFTFYLGVSVSGRAIIPKLKSSGKRLRSKLKKISEWMKKNRNKYPLRKLWEIFCSKLKGHVQYYGVSFNADGVGLFLYKARRIFYKWVNRRSQRKSFNWGKFSLFVKRFPMPKAKVCHKFFF